MASTDGRNRSSRVQKGCQRRFGTGVFGAVAFDLKGGLCTWLAINDALVSESGSITII
ncbi:hypothetical protein KBY96_02210 [Cyanobium sp. ATX 6A2]|uniref:hypothetical protein n=1 Tax=Cyanobium sp. ATX 6A2 TaxID=2823700 RepID=UPI0020CBC3E4|nr:hypothetical protein [Cyanobium sp. ATX 6A2]MCP9886752.1 hypothetical protein [Cyanobium sp. ATX 6A2]